MKELLASAAGDTSPPVVLSGVSMRARIETRVHAQPSNFLETKMTSTVRNIATNQGQSAHWDLRFGSLIFRLQPQFDKPADGF
jgi:dissimilatory sulfite reductase (desulfoviridin) alpha/beta subunit